MADYPTSSYSPQDALKAYQDILASQKRKKKYNNLNYKLYPYTDYIEQYNKDKEDKVTFPKIFINDTAMQYEKLYIGGFEDFNKWLTPTIDYSKLKEISKVITKNLNNIIDYNYYPTKNTKTSNFKHRPICIGVQGFVNLLYELKLPFDSEEAKIINDNIFETIYYGALEMSLELSKERSIDMKLYKSWTEQLKDGSIYKEFSSSDEYKNIIKRYYE